MYKLFLKRSIDLIIATAILPILLIILVILGPIIYFSDKGSIFYTASRLGKNGEVFKMYKFRSMKVNSPDIRNVDGSTFNAENDPRLTYVGRLLRKTSLDEVPQLINILNGSMSFIGPRPDLPEAIKLYTTKEARKLEVRPGITGFNQAFYRNSVSSKEKFNNDVFYVDNLSLIMDIKILFHTILSVVMKKNIYITNDSERD